MGPGTTVLLWIAPVDENAPPADGDCLSPAELDRATRIRHLGTRRRFVAGRMLVRRCLSHLAPVDPAAWRFRLTEGGRPELDGPATTLDLRFNLTHSEGLVACVVTAGLDCGVDVEPLDRRVDVTAIARHSFAAEESAALANLGSRDRRARFLSLWTLKEAYLKALGSGIRLRLDAVTFRLDEPKLIGVRIAEPTTEDVAHWHFTLFQPGARHLLAVALRTGARPTPRIELGRMDLTTGIAQPLSATPLRSSDR